MKRIFSSRRDHHLVEVCVFFITVALITGATGCAPAQYTLSISSNTGGTVIEPGEGSFTYAHDTVVDLVVEAEEGYGLTWTGDVDWIANIHSFSTNITMYDNYSITATFVEIQEIQDWYDLDAIRDNLSGHYALMDNLDSATAGYEELASQTANQGKGWQPIGSTAEPFTGHFDGQEYEIRDLFINRPEEDNVALFGSVDEGGFIRNISVVNTIVLGYDDVGCVVGWNDGTVSNCYATGNISGHYNVGGLVGSNYDGSVTDSYSNGSMSGKSTVGGLVGFNHDIVRNSHSFASVLGTMVGGLVGLNWDNGTVSNCYSTGNGTGDESVYGYGELVGGLVATNRGDISSSYSTSTVTGDRYIGGLVAVNAGDLNNSYSIANVTGTYCVGGLVGANSGSGGNNGVVSNSYSTGSVTGMSYVGGLVGWNDEGTVSNSFWDMETSGQSTSAGGTGKTTAQMKSIATFSGAGWNITAVANPGTRNPSYIWNIVDGVTYPFLS
jgi:hypothetical protein